MHLPNVSKPVLVSALRWIYCRDLSVLDFQSPQLALELYLFADQYLMPSLATAALEQLYQHVNESNVAEYLPVFLLIGQEDFLLHGLSVLADGLSFANLLDTSTFVDTHLSGEGLEEFRLPASYLQPVERAIDSLLLRTPEGLLALLKGGVSLHGPLTSHLTGYRQWLLEAHPLDTVSTQTWQPLLRFITAGSDQDASVVDLLFTKVQDFLVLQCGLDELPAIVHAQTPSPKAWDQFILGKLTRLPYRFASHILAAESWLKAWKDTVFLEEAKASLVCGLSPEPLISWIALALKYSLGGLFDVLLQVLVDPGLADIVEHDSFSKSAINSPSVASHLLMIINYLPVQGSIYSPLRAFSLEYAASHTWTSSTVHIGIWEQLYELHVPSINEAILNWIRLLPDVRPRSVMQAEGLFDMFRNHPDLLTFAKSCVRYFEVIRHDNLLRCMKFGEALAASGLVNETVQYLLTSDLPADLPTDYLLTWIFTNSPLIPQQDLLLLFSKPDIIRVSAALPEESRIQAISFLIRCAEGPDGHRGWLQATFSGLAAGLSFAGLHQFFDAPTLQSLAPHIFAGLLQATFVDPQISELTLFIMFSRWRALQRELSPETEAELLAHIRFPLFSPDQLAEIVEVHAIPSHLVALQRLRFSAALKAPRSSSHVSWGSFPAWFTLPDAGHAQPLSLADNHLTVQVAAGMDAPALVNIQSQPLAPRYGTYLFLVRQPALASAKQLQLSCDRCHSGPSRPPSTLVCGRCLSFRACGRICMARHPEMSCQRMKEALGPSALAGVQLSNRIIVGVAPSVSQGHWVGAQGLSTNGVVLGKKQPFFAGANAAFLPHPFRSEWVGIACSADTGAIRLFTFGTLDPASIMLGTRSEPFKAADFPLFLAVAPPLCLSCDAAPAAASSSFCSESCRKYHEIHCPGRSTVDHAATHQMHLLPTCRWTGSTPSLTHISDAFTSWIESIQAGQEASPETLSPAPPPLLTRLDWGVLGWHQPQPHAEAGAVLQSSSSASFPSTTAPSPPPEAQAQATGLAGIVEMYIGAAPQPKVEVGEAIEQVTVNQDAHTMFSCFADGEMVKRFTSKAARIGQVGTAYIYMGGMVNGTVISVELGSQMVLTLRQPTFPPGHMSLVVIRVEGNPEGSTVTIHHANIPLPALEKVREFWRKTFFDNWCDKLQFKIERHLTNRGK
ncbi:MAG: hypothetical protein Q8P67_10440 [archaeon]|nr:hypothetical protein [archaeon]